MFGLDAFVGWSTAFLGPSLGQGVFDALPDHRAGLEIADDGPDALAPDPILKGGEWIGYVTSASRGFRIGKNLALGYVRRGSLEMGQDCLFRTLGIDRRARRHHTGVYDPENSRLTS